MYIFGVQIKTLAQFKCIGRIYIFSEINLTNAFIIHDSVNRIVVNLCITETGSQMSGLVIHLFHVFSFLKNLGSRFQPVKVDSRKSNTPTSAVI